jgi:hypothetical protein
MKQHLFLGLILMATLSAGCQSTREIKLVNRFDQAEFQKRLEPTGKNTIKGNAFIRLANGSIQSCAGFSVSLVPTTPYSTERIVGIYGNSDRGINRIRANETIKFNPDNPEYLKFMRNAVCNAQGMFTFDKVQDGEYFLTTGIQWLIHGDPNYALTAVYDGYNLFQRVKVFGGKTEEVVLSP